MWRFNSGVDFFRVVDFRGILDKALYKTEISYRCVLLLGWCETRAVDSDLATTKFTIIDHLVFTLFF